MKILVTGSSGYLGNAFIKQFKDEHDIIGLDRDNRKRDYKKVQGDLSNYKKIMKNLDEIKDVDCIVHFASLTDIKECEKNKMAALETNLMGTWALLEHGKRVGIRKFIYISTGSIYKKTEKEVSEEDETEADNFYESTKLMAEEICKQYSNKFDIIMLRPFFPYGKNTHPNRLINKIIQNVKDGKSIILNRKNKPIVSPIYVDDMSNAIDTIIKKDKEEKISIYNLAGPNGYSIKEIAEIIGKIINKKPKYQKGKSDSSNFCGSAIRLKSLGIKLHNIEEGLRLTME